MIAALSVGGLTVTGVVISSVVIGAGPAAAAPAPGVLAVIAGRENVCAAPTPGPATSSAFCGAAGVAVDGSGNTYVADFNNDVVEKITASGILSVFAGDGVTNPISCTALSPCPASQVSLFEPDGVAVDGAGNVFIADFADHLVEKVTPAGSLSVFAGNGTNGSPTPGPATGSDLGAPNGVGVDQAGDLFIADSNQFVEKVTTAGTLSIFAGTGTGGAPTPGPATSSQLNEPNAVAFDGAGNAYIADVNNNVVERVTVSGTLSLFAGTGTGGAPTPGPATASKLRGPEGVAFDGAGNAYIADSNNNLVEKVTPAGTLSVFAGTGTAGLPTPGPATGSKLNGPGAVAVDSGGDVDIADTNNGVIEEVGGVLLPPLFTADSPPAAPSGLPYSYTFAASGNPAPTFTVSSGSLPAGLSLNSVTGVLSGTPTGSGTFTVTATNTAGSVGAGPFTLGSALAAGGAALASTPDGAGYWTAGADGAVTPHGTATAYGSLTDTTLARPVVGMAASSDGRGYWLVGADGGVFTFGDAPFYGSLSHAVLTEPVVAMATTPDAKGYWLVGADGGVFSFGDASFAGSLAGTRLAQPIVAMASTPDGKGYWLVGADGGVFSFGDASFAGSLAGTVLAGPVVGLAPTSDGRGYWLVGADGGVFTFGDAPFAGSGAAAGVTALGLIPAASGTTYAVIGSSGSPVTL